MIVAIAYLSHKVLMANESKLANKNPLVFRYAYFSLKISPVISHKR
jgi:hypothetical protein